MNGYTIEDIDPTETPVAIEQWYDRSVRSWATILVNADGQQVGDALYDGTKADRDASRAQMQRVLDAAS